MRKTKSSYKIVVTRVENGIRVAIGKVTLRTPTEFVKWKKKAFSIDFGCPLYIQGLMRVYAVDWQTGKQVVTGEGEQALMQPSELDVAINTRVIRELTGGLGIDPWDKVVPLLIGAIIGALAGFLAGYLIMQAELTEVYRMLAESAVIIPDNPPSGPAPWVNRILAVLTGGR